MPHEIKISVYLYLCPNKQTYDACVHAYAYHVTIDVYDCQRDTGTDKQADSDSD